MKRGLFVTFEGPDRIGKSTQVPLLTRRIKDLDKYQDVLETHEPWKSKEIKRRLEQDKDSYSGGRELADLYVEDRARHTRELIRPVLKTEGIVISDRYKMSTCAYQWAQGVRLHELLELHEDRGIILPDITFCFDSSFEEILERGQRRGATSGSLEKFERDNEFSRKVLEAYRSLAHMAQVDEFLFGKVIRVDASDSIEKISETIWQNFLPLYSSWRNNEYQPLEKRNS